MSELIINILGVLGGAGIIIFGLSKFIGTIVQNRIKENERKQTEESLEIDRQKYGLSRVQADRYANSQYDIYIEIWQTLQGMKFAVESLWGRANNQNIATLAKLLRETRLKADNWSLFFDEDHLKELNRLLKILEKFSAGKASLVRIRNKNDIPRYFVEELEQRVITQNQHYKQEFESLLEKMRVSFKERLSTIE